MRESDLASTSTWKQAWVDLARKKTDKFAAVAQRLKALQQEDAQERSSMGIKSINMQSAARIENKGKLIAGATMPNKSTNSGPYRAQPLAKIKQDVKIASANTH